MTRRNSEGDTEGSKIRKRKRGRDSEPDEHPTKINQEESADEPDTDNSRPPVKDRPHKKAKPGFTSKHFTDTVQIIAGPENEPSEPMIVYTSAARKVPFFKACLEHDFKEKQDKIIRLPEDDPEVVDAFLRLVILGDHVVFLHLAEILEVGNWVDAPESDVLVVKIYILADKLGAEEQQNILVDFLRYLYCMKEFEVPSPKAIDVLVDAGMAKSKLFKFLVRQMAFALPSAANLELHEIPHALFADIKEWVRRGGVGVSAVFCEILTRDVDAVSEASGNKIGLDNYKLPYTNCNAWHTHLTTTPCNGSAYRREEERLAKEPQRLTG
jgi:hypothetical protein